jgi:fructokinase
MMTPTLAAATDRFLEIAQQGGAKLVVDLNVRAHLWADKSQMRDAVARLVRGASIVKGSFDDLVALTGRRDILWLADHAPRAAWIVTQGAKGASAIGDHGFVARPALRAKCVDATGAGDAFIAGVLAKLLAAEAAPGTPAWKDERVWTEALDVGHMLGAKAIAQAGAVTGLVGLTAARARLRSGPKSTRATRATSSTQASRRK